jgi:uroporphyrin-III C-methyltransferase
METITVSLVGAGPGDPELITLKGARKLGAADVVYYDALVSRELLSLCRPGARLVPVGKRRGVETMSQEEIIGCLIRDGRARRRVVRLKGGDPFVFGRGGEEAIALLEAGVDFEVVPGVSAGIAVPALAGIPITHRGASSSVAFVTAHDLSSTRDGRKGQRRLAGLARSVDTLVIFMAKAERSRVRRTLIAAGLSGETPVALIESGSTPRETVLRSTLGELDGDEMTPAGGGPALLVIGPTVALSDRLRPRAAQVLEDRHRKEAV